MHDNYIFENLGRDFNKSFDKNFGRMIKINAILAGCGFLTALAIAGGLIWAAVRIWGG